MVSELVRTLAKPNSDRLCAQAAHVLLKVCNVSHDARCLTIFLIEKIDRISVAHVAYRLMVKASRIGVHRCALQTNQFK